MWNSSWIATTPPKTMGRHPAFDELCRTHKLQEYEAHTLSETQHPLIDAALEAYGFNDDLDELSDTLKIVLEQLIKENFQAKLDPQNPADLLDILTKFERSLESLRPVEPSLPSLTIQEQIHRLESASRANNQGQAFVLLPPSNLPFSSEINDEVRTYLQKPQAETLYGIVSNYSDESQPHQHQSKFKITSPVKSRK